MNALDRQSNDGPDGSSGPAELSEIVRTCQGTPEFAESLAELYRQADRQIAQLNPSCNGGGECCKFDQAGHLLYLSGIELAYLLEIEPPLPAQAKIKLCPYQIGPKCTARQRRPLGCRTFFCEKALDEPLRAIHEQFHEKLRNMHIQWGIDYFYSELTSSILGLMDDLN